VSPELETLDQLLGGDMPLEVVREWYDCGPRFARSVEAMLHAGEVRLVADGADVPRWRWTEVLSAAAERSTRSGARLAITAVGVRRIG
jgi:hypothetical protein